MISCHLGEEWWGDEIEIFRITSSINLLTSKDWPPRWVLTQNKSGEWLNLISQMLSSPNLRHDLSYVKNRLLHTFLVKHHTIHKLSSLCEREKNLKLQILSLKHIEMRRTNIYKCKFIAIRCISFCFKYLFYC